MKKYLFTIAMLMLTTIGCMAQKGNVAKPGERPEVLIETTMGNIRVQLYNETPLHRDNFLNLIRQHHFYDSVLFHRVIPDFMIQAGDPWSKNAAAGEELGEHSVGDDIPAEIRLPQIYHKRGALAAAREGDDVNPERKSSGSQFYIVYGKKQDDDKLDKLQHRLDSAFNDSIKMTEEMRQTYRNVGGTPHLDGFYTVFGEVTEGMDVVDRIQHVATDKNDRPIDDVRIIKATITKDLPEFAAKARTTKKTTSKRPTGRKARR